ncbi:MAG: hypothetical protein PHN84_11025 [Desulfuromonadaceae bacterium]|nr:hypothetical protein [Desulfuromonadaceae bacterium]
MSNHNDDIKLKLAWQTAFELRTCPDNKTLHAADLDENLSRHLAICHVCRDKREMQQDERDAWKTLKEKFATLTMKPGIGTDKKAGQVWTINREFGGWRVDGRYIKPPSVMLLEKVDGTSGWRVAQLYSDTRLMGSGDVTLDERYGFAETWNCYSLKEDRFDKCLGGVKPDELKQAITASVTAHEPAPEGSILSFFRSMEIEVGAFVAVPAVAELVEEWEAKLANNEVFLQNIIGSLADAYQKLAGFKLPEFAESLIDLLSGATDPHGILPVVASTSVPLSVNIVIKHMDGAITIRTVGATLTDNNWEDGDYYVAGKLNEIQNEELFLVASLNVNGKVVCECQSNIEKDSPYFDIVFSDVAKDAGAIENLKFILVRP